MATGRSVQLTKQVGEYLVAAEICRRGFVAATFTGNVPNYDIVATNETGYSTLVQVKAIAGAAWQFDIRKFVDVRLDGSRQRLRRLTPPPPGNIVQVFVKLADYGFDRFYVLRWEDLQQVAVDHYRVYLEKHGGVRPKKPDSFHCALRPSDLAPYESKWDLLGAL